jgi:ribonuclease Z
MPKLILLGTASAVSEEGHENSFLVIRGETTSILVDCSIKPVRRLREAGIDFQDVSALIITHFHPDHVGGLGNLLMDMWILGRKSEFTIYGSQHSLSRAKVMMDLYDWESWSGMYPVRFHALPMEELSEVLETEEFHIQSSPVEHMIPTLGLRIEHQGRNFILAYSSDTSPVEQTVRLASGADVLIHEAAGKGNFHSSAAEAGEIAARAGVKTLYLTHYSLGRDARTEDLVAQAKKTFPGNVILAEDLMEIPFDLK